MSFGGAVAAMISSIKNNSRSYKRKSAFDGRGEKTKNNTPLRFKNEGDLSPEQLKALGEKTKKEGQIRQIKLLVVCILLFGLLLYLGDLWWQYLND